MFCLVNKDPEFLRLKMFSAFVKIGGIRRFIHLSFSIYHLLSRCQKLDER